MTQRDFDNILGGAWSVTFGGVDLGHTMGETRLSIEPRLLEVDNEVEGEGADLVHLGDVVTVSVCLAEWTAATLAKIAPTLSAISGGLGLGCEGGARLSSEASTLVLHPLEADDIASCDITIWKAVPIGPARIRFSPDSDTVVDAVFRALPDSSKADGQRLGRIGAS